MALCKACGAEFEWGYMDGRWVPLEPLSGHDDLARTYVDENGLLRADHRDRHEYGASVNVTRLDQKIPATVANNPGPALDERIRRLGRWRRRA